MLTLSQERLINEFNRNIKWLKKEGISKLPKPPEWVSYEQACEILPMCKDWYRRARKEKLIEGVDWRSINGKKIEYRVSSLERLKEEMTQKHINKP
ncbi:MAG TPA: hypothetical protein VD996_02665 [Chitinophagaceae bacterium]|nr:hypothetical protein [Chitinophagaceae bacterium]